MATQALFDFATDCQVETDLQVEADCREAFAPESLSLAELGPAETDPADEAAEVSADPDSGDGEPVSLSRDALLDRLQSKFGTGQVSLASRQATFSTGSPDVDAWLPAGGLKTAAMTEWIAAVPHGGAMTLALVAAARKKQADRLPESARRSESEKLVVVDPAGTFYPPALTGLGIDVGDLIWCRPESDADAVWSIDQSLRSGAVAAVVAVIDHRLDDRDARRFQLAAEIGQTPALLIRSAIERGRPSFAETRFHVASRHLDAHQVTGMPATAAKRQRFFQVTLDRCKGAVTGQSLWLSIDDRFQIRRAARTGNEKAVVHLASRLADPTKKPVPRRNVG